MEEPSLLGNRSLQDLLSLLKSNRADSLRLKESPAGGPGPSAGPAVDPMEELAQELSLRGFDSARLPDIPSLLQALGTASGNYGSGMGLQLDSKDLEAAIAASAVNAAVLSGGAHQPYARSRLGRASTPEGEQQQQQQQQQQLQGAPDLGVPLLQPMVNPAVGSAPPSPHASAPAGAAGFVGFPPARAPDATPGVAAAGGGGGGVLLKTMAAAAQDPSALHAMAQQPLADHQFRRSSYPGMGSEALGNPLGLSTGLGSGAAAAAARVSGSGAGLPYAGGMADGGGAYGGMSMGAVPYGRTSPGTSMHTGMSGLSGYGGGAVSGPEVSTGAVGGGPEAGAGATSKRASASGGRGRSGAGGAGGGGGGGTKRSGRSRSGTPQLSGLTGGGDSGESSGEEGRTPEQALLDKVDWAMVAAMPPIEVFVQGLSRQVDEQGKRRPLLVEGSFHLDRYLRNQDCIWWNGQWVSRSRFEKEGGSTTAKWHCSIKVTSEKIALGTWLNDHKLPVLKGQKRKSKRQRVSEANRAAMAAANGGTPGVSPLGTPNGTPGASPAPSGGDPLGRVSYNGAVSSGAPHSSPLRTGAAAAVGAPITTAGAGALGMGSGMGLHPAVVTGGMAPGDFRRLSEGGGVTTGWGEARRSDSSGIGAGGLGAGSLGAGSGIGAGGLGGGGGMGPGAWGAGGMQQQQQQRSGSPFMVHGGQMGLGMPGGDGAGRVSASGGMGLGGMGGSISSSTHLGGPMGGNLGGWSSQGLAAGGGMGMGGGGMGGGGMGGGHMSLVEELEAAAARAAAAGLQPNFNRGM